MGYNDRAIVLWVWLKVTLCVLKPKGYWSLNQEGPECAAKDLNSGKSPALFTIGQCCGKTSVWIIDSYKGILEKH